MGRSVFHIIVPPGFTDYFDVNGLENQKTVHHEYFHGVQHTHIYTKDRSQRDKLLGPVWFNEGAAEYMAQVAVEEGRASGLIDMFKTEDRWTFEFYEQMQRKLESWEDAFVATYGLSSDDFMAEFDTFLGLSLSEPMKILPK